MSKGRTTGDRLDGVEPDPSKVKMGKPQILTPEQQDEVMEATLNGLSEKKIKAMITRFVKKSPNGSVDSSHLSFR